MRSRLAAIVAIAAAVSAASVAVGAASVDEAVTVRSPARRVEIPSLVYPSLDERPGHDMLAIINRERLERGLPIVFWDDRVATAAAAHSADMAARQRLSHTGSDGSNGGTRLDRAGVVWLSWGENIGAGFNDPQVLFDAWANSPAHAAHLFGNFTYIGVGVAASAGGVAYWTLDLTI